MNPFLLTRKRIIVTGASRGIGRAAARVMASLGARVLLVARSEDALHEVAAEIRGDGGEAQVSRADITSLEDTRAYVARAEALWGGIDGLFANAGVTGAVAPLTEYPLEEFQSVLNTNVLSLFWALRLVLPGMIAQGSGSILATGSLSSERGLPMTSPYNTSKHAVLGLVRSAASEVAQHNVRVNCLLPGLIHTQILEDIAGVLADGDVQKGLATLGAIPPQQRVGTAEETAYVAAFLLSDAAAYVNAQAWGVDGGMLGIQSNGG